LSTARGPRNSNLAVAAVAAFVLLATMAYGFHAKTRVHEAESALERHFDAHRWVGKVPRAYRGGQVELVCETNTGETVVLRADLLDARRMEVVVQFDDEGIATRLATFHRDSIRGLASAEVLPAPGTNRRYYKRTGAWSDGQAILSVNDDEALRSGEGGRRAADLVLRIRFLPG
jgi:hypothetical protein